MPEPAERGGGDGLPLALEAPGQGPAVSVGVWDDDEVSE
jgi:hypothetical protein